MSIDLRISVYYILIRIDLVFVCLLSLKGSYTTLIKGAGVSLIDSERFVVNFYIFQFKIFIKSYRTLELCVKLKLMMIARYL